MNYFKHPPEVLKAEPYLPRTIGLAKIVGNVKVVRAGGGRRALEQMEQIGPHLDVGLRSLEESIYELLD